MDQETNSEKSNDLVDRISDFPDLIISLILSFMPTKDVVASSILSKRWQFMWMTVENFDFRYEEVHYHNLLPIKSIRQCIQYGFPDVEIENPNLKFALFVSKILVEARSITKFRLHWKPLVLQHICFTEYLDRWISIISDMNVPELYLSLKNVHMPISIFNCQCLESLELNCVIGISCKPMFHLPRLESLKLHSVYFYSDEAFQVMMSGCPILKYLHINVATGFMKRWDPLHENFEGVFRFIVSSNSMRRIEMRAHYPKVTIGNCLYELELDTPSLEYIKLDFMIFRIFLGQNLSSLVEANFGLNSYVVYSQYIKNNFRSSFVKEIYTLSSVVALNLSRPVMEALNNARFSFFPDFIRLKRLRVTADCLRWSALQSFIQCSARLESMTFEKEHSCFPGVLYESNWSDPEVVPRCLSNSLKTIRIAVYDCHGEQLTMIGYMLKHGGALQLMRISCSKEFRSKFLVLEELGKLPRKSLACKVEFRC